MGSRENDPSSFPVRDLGCKTKAEGWLILSPPQVDVGLSAGYRTSVWSLHVVGPSTKIIGFQSKRLKKENRVLKLYFSLDLASGHFCLTHWSRVHLSLSIYVKRSTNITTGWEKSHVKLQ